MGKIGKIALGTSAAMVGGIWLLALAGENVEASLAQEDSQELISSENSTLPVAPPVKRTAAAAMASAYPVESCKAAIALIMDRDPSTIQGRKLPDGLAHVSYTRPDDGRRWQARCQVVDEAHIRWAAFDAFGDGQQGRWRDEDKIRVEVGDGRLQIDVDQSGVIAKRESYDLSALSS